MLCGSDLLVWLPVSATDTCFIPAFILGYLNSYVVGMNTYNTTDMHIPAK